MRVEGSDGDCCATVPACTVHELGLRGLKRASCGPLPIAEQEGRFFVLNSYLIRLIHLEVYLTYKQDLLTPKQMTLISN